jgi:hypothetical protein
MSVSLRVGFAGDSMKTSFTGEEFNAFVNAVSSDVSTKSTTTPNGARTSRKQSHRSAVDGFGDDHAITALEQTEE